jgi:hypothetical protein
LLLSAYVVVQAVFGLLTRHAAETSPIGIVIAIVAAVGMPVLAKQNCASPIRSTVAHFAPMRSKRLRVLTFHGYCLPVCS